MPKGDDELCKIFWSAKLFHEIMGKLLNLMNKINLCVYIKLKHFAWVKKNKEEKN